MYNLLNNDAEQKIDYTSKTLLNNYLSIREQRGVKFSLSSSRSLTAPGPPARGWSQPADGQSQA